MDLSNVNNIPSADDVPADTNTGGFTAAPTTQWPVRIAWALALTSLLVALALAAIYLTPLKAKIIGGTKAVAAEKDKRLSPDVVRRDYETHKGVPAVQDEPAFYKWQAQNYYPAAYELENDVTGLKHGVGFQKASNRVLWFGLLILVGLVVILAGMVIYLTASVLKLRRMGP